MSRARDFTDPVTKKVHWFDVHSSRATVAQLALLADIEGIDVDDLLDEGLSQRKVIDRLHQADGLIPAQVLERRRLRMDVGRLQPACRVCSIHGWECEGPITRHHFVMKWLMRELSTYEAYAARTLCTIPVCLGRHADFHERGDKLKSVVPYLREHEREFAQKLITQLKEERPKLFELILSGTGDSYEGQLAHDFVHDAFVSTAVPAYELPEYCLAEAA